MYYLGVDYHKSFSYCTMMDEQVRIIKQGKIKNCTKDEKIKRGSESSEGSNIKEVVDDSILCFEAEKKI